MAVNPWIILSGFAMAAGAAAIPSIAKKFSEKNNYQLADYYEESRIFSTQEYEDMDEGFSDFDLSEELEEDLEDKEDEEEESALDNSGTEEEI